MIKTHKNSILIILVSAVLVAILFNLKSFIGMFELLEMGTSDLEVREGIAIRMRLAVSGIVFHMLVFFVIAYFNYTWHNRFIPDRFPSAVKAVLVVSVNILVFYFFARIETVISNHLLGDYRSLHKAFFPDYYLFLNLSTGIVAAAVAYLLRMIERSRSAELQNMKLREEKASAELAVLKEQISPHFFFNTLNSLTAVIRTGSKKDSLDYVQKMSDVYRYILDSESRDMVPLTEELAFLESYSLLLSGRFSNNLRITVTISDCHKKAEILPLALQGLLENAVKHNIISAEKPLRVSVVSDGDFIAVENNITGKKEPAGHGVGLANLNKRCKMIMRSEIEIRMDTSCFQVKVPLILPKK